MTEPSPGPDHARRDIAFHRETASSYDASITREHAIYHCYSLYPFLDRLSADGGLALDLGCGTGVVALALADRGWQVIALDHSPEMVAIAKRKSEEAGVDARIDFRIADLFDADLPAGSVELVTCQGILHHLADPYAAVPLVARLLKPGGSFYISEPCVRATPVGKAIAAAVRLAMGTVRLIRRRPRAGPSATVEAPINAAELFRALDELGLVYEAEFVTHLPLAHLILPDRMRLRASLALSRPWRRRKGDIVFIEGHAPT